MAPIGIRHIHLLVADHDRSIAFYTQAFGMVEVFRAGPLVLLGTPGSGDSLALHAATTEDERARIGQHGGLEHFGVHVQDRSPQAIDDQVRQAEAAGATLLERGEHGAGLSYARISDPDGYTIEISGPAGMPSRFAGGQPGQR